MLNNIMSADKAKVVGRRLRWIIYSSLVVIVPLVLGVCALSFFGTFSRLRNKPISPQIIKLLRAQTLALNIPFNPDPYVTVYATPQDYGAYWRALRNGNQKQRLQLEHSGRVISLPGETAVWYQPMRVSGVLTPVRLIGSKHIGRTYWVASGGLS